MSHIGLILKLTTIWIVAINNYDVLVGLLKHLHLGKHVVAPVVCNKGFWIGAD